jgi:hypothetical protein
VATVIGDSLSTLDPCTGAAAKTGAIVNTPRRALHYNPADSRGANAMTDETEKREQSEKSPKQLAAEHTKEWRKRYVEYSELPEARAAQWDSILTI